jgi:hypothetical protein
MRRWTPNTPPPPPPQPWQSRAEILKAHLDSLSPLELLGVRPDYYARTWGWDFKNKRYASGRLALYEALERRAGFNPSQPRVPAGNPDGGQWTNADGAVGDSIGDNSGLAVSIETEAVEPGVQSVASRVTIDYSRALTGDSFVDGTTKKLSQVLAQTMQRMDFIPTWTPQVYGTAAHVAFGNAVKSAGFEGIAPRDVEHSFFGGGSADYGQPGSIRTDVVLRNAAGDVIAIYDVKTGGATLTAARVRELREKTGVGFRVPIIELHVIRGATLRGRVNPKRIIGTVLARLWNP